MDKKKKILDLREIMNKEQNPSQVVPRTVVNESVKQATKNPEQAVQAAQPAIQAEIDIAEQSGNISTEDAQKTRELVSRNKKVTKKEKKGVAGQFAEALTLFAPQLLGTAVAGIVGGADAAAEAFKIGEGIQNTIRDASQQKFDNQQAELQSSLLAEQKRAGIKTNQINAQASLLKAENEKNKAETKDQFSIKGDPTSTVSRTSDGRFFTTDANGNRTFVDQSQVENTDQRNKERELELKAQENVIKQQEAFLESKPELKDVLNVKKNLTSNLKNIGIQEISTSFSKIAALSKGQTAAPSDLVGTDGKKIKTDPSGANDIALVINFMKMADPGSVVREGEFKTAAKAGPLYDNLKATWLQKPKTGAFLTPEVRSQLLEAAQRQAKAAFDNGKAIEADTLNLGRSHNIDPSQLQDPSLRVLGNSLGVETPRQKLERLRKEQGN